MAGKLLRFLNSLVTVTLALALVTCGLYAGFALWDNSSIYAMAENNVAEARELREMAAKDLEQVLLMDSAENAAGAAAAQTAMDTAPAEDTKDGQTVAGDPAEGLIAEPTPAPAEAAAAEATEAPAAADPAEPTAATASAPTAEPEQTEEAQESPTESFFRRLKAINEDICGYIIMYGTAIEYPVLQGKTNLDYVSTDMYGNFAVPGSIFLDVRNKNDYSMVYNLLYGHNMSEHRMFGDVNLYKDEKFFKENTRGAFYQPEGAYYVQTISVILTDARDSIIFNPRNWEHMTNEQILDAVQKNAVHVSEEGMKALEARMADEEKPTRILALSTCSSEFTDARTILLTLIDPPVVVTSEGS